MGKKKSNPAQTAIVSAQNAYNQLQTQSNPNQEAANNFANQAASNLSGANAQANADYGRIMGGYQDFRSRLKPTKFSFERVNAERPAELGESYGYLREAMPGYREFAKTGGYSEQDQQELRARGISPIRSAYGGTMRELDRSRSLGSSGGQGQYVAARSRAQRELPEQMAEAMTGVNASLADAIRQGRMFGLGGITQTGSTMGQLSSAEAGRMLQASLANQQADLQAQGMSEESIQNNLRNELASYGGETSLYGTTPGMSNMFGQQALAGWGLGNQMENSRNQYGLGLLDAQLRGAQMQPQSTPWWKTALQVAGTAAPYVGMAFGPAGMLAGGALNRATSGLSGQNAAAGNWGGMGSSNPYRVNLGGVG